ncbi:hypothetical protein AJ78_01865 [Emergomyces pasteurianus Ep9510]|uniref:Peroxisomal membrane protein PEX14 n=1 Tax=Emergomyces pasteurianus Ep9510 TaxID=1447872 RepID=A0A1J9QS58_9EURO|nr:hypothetical protein AJ78_01865 [Emergomyces pasteurianus Ep9510]
MALREELVSSAISFLQDPSVSSAPLEKKIAFLQSKNLTQEEIDQALSRVGEDSSAAFTQNSTPSTVVQQSSYRHAPQQYVYGSGGQWQPSPPPPELPKRDWRDWFIMATVMGGVGYGLYSVAKRYITPLIVPPTPPQLQQDKESIDEQFSRAFALLDQLSSDTATLKAAEEARTEHLDAALREVENVISDLKTSSRRRDEDTRRIGEEVKGLKDSIPKAIDGAREGNDKRLKELGSELRSLKVLLGNRLSSAASSVSTAPPNPLPSSSTPQPSQDATVNRSNGATTSSQTAPLAPVPTPAPQHALTPAPRETSSSPFSQLGKPASIPAWQMAAANKSKTATVPSPSVENADSHTDDQQTTRRVLPGPTPGLGINHRLSAQKLQTSPSPSQMYKANMDTSKHHREAYRSYRSRSRSRSRSQAISTSHSPVSDRSRRRDRYDRHHRTSNGRRTRSRSPERKSNRHSRRKHERQVAAAPATLPFDARQLSKHDLQLLEPMFALYLDIQKNLDIADLDEREVKGRWKSFVGKWNRGELAEGWYDPSTFQKAQQESAAGTYERVNSPLRRASPDYDERYERARREGTNDTPRERSTSAATPLDETTKDTEDEDEDHDEEEESYGPKFPTLDSSLALDQSTSRNRSADHRSGPTVPTFQDLQLQRESQKEDHKTGFMMQHKEISLARASHKAQIRSAEEEIAPRAEPGTRERRLEKKRETAAANRAFAESKTGGDDDCVVADDELMGGGSGGGDDLALLKKQREKEARKKNEREIRREEMLRARAAEREERLKAYRRREEETMSVLKALAKQRFG